MTTAIGVVMTERIVAGRLEDQQLAGEPLHYPEDAEELDALLAIPGERAGGVLARKLQLARRREPVDASAWPFRALFARAWWKTRRTCRRSKGCAWPRS